MFTDRHRVSLHRHYYRILRQQHSLYSDLDAAMAEASIRPISEDQIDATLGELEENYEKREQAAVIGITFAGMCLEAFFYDYAATKLGDTFAEENLDKLDLPSKLLIVPRLVCGKAVEKSSHVYERVKRLTKERNYLVHFRSKGFELSELHRASQFHDELNQRFRDALTNGVEAIPMVMKVIGELDGMREYYVRMLCD